jgi:hypothetical protein
MKSLCVTVVLPYFSKRFEGCKYYILMQRQLNDSNTTLTKEEFSQF